MACYSLVFAACALAVSAFVAPPSTVSTSRRPVASRMPHVMPATRSAAAHMTAMHTDSVHIPDSLPVQKKKVLVLGGDGFCGWPTALHLSERGHEVLIVDNLSRRNIDNELGASSLTPIATIQERVRVWNELTGRDLRFHFLDLNDYESWVKLLETEQPDSVVHFAEQRSAPYSMKSPLHKRYTINNNVDVTHNVLCGIVESGLDIHLCHLGTMGVYGYGNSGGTIPEGYVDVTMPNGDEKTILHPAYPGSIYHATKCLDAIMFQFYNKNDGLRVTDLHQGIVWGTNTKNTALDERLTNRFDYDGDYGTVLNRFLMQAACGIPLTVHGTGGQTRALIHISDTARCIQLALENPPESGAPVEILNQIAETQRVKDLAEKVAGLTGAEVQYIANPRKEAAENELVVANQKFKLLGLDPILLDDSLLTEVTQITKKYLERVDRRQVLARSYWNKDRAAECEEKMGEVEGGIAVETSAPKVAA